MHRLVIAPMLLTVAACATSPLEPPAASSFAVSDSAAAAPIVDSASIETGIEATLGSTAPAVVEETVDIEELDSGLVCEYERRPGSHIAEKYCYTREERAANQAARNELVRRQMRALSMEQEQRAAWERELARTRGVGRVSP